MSADSHPKKACYSLVNKRSQGRALLKWGYLYCRHVQGGEVKPVPSVPLGKEKSVIRNMPWSAASQQAGTLPPDLSSYHGCLNLTWKSPWPFATALQTCENDLWACAELEVVRLAYCRLVLDIRLLVGMNSWRDTDRHLQHDSTNAT